MFSQQRSTRISHAINVERLRYQMGVVPQKRGRRFFIQNSVPVNSVGSIVAGVEITLDLLGVFDHYIL